VEKRIIHKFSENGSDYAKWLNNVLRPKLQGGEPPRKVITLANQILMNGEYLPEESPSQVLKSEFSEELARTLDDLPQPDAERLQKSLRLFLENRYRFNAENDTPLNNTLGIQLKGQIDHPEKHQPLVYAFFFNTSYNGNSVCASYRNAVKFLEEKPQAQCYYVTDERCQFRVSWKKAAEYREDFLQKGGKMFTLNKDAAAVWFALLFLSDKVKSGDVVRTGTEETVTETQLADYIQNHFPHDLIDLKSAKVQPINVPDSENVENKENEKNEIVSVPTEKTETTAAVSSPPNNSSNVKTSSSKKSEEKIAAEQSDNEAVELLNNLIQTLKKLKLPVKPYLPQSYQCGPRLIRLRIVPDQTQGVTVKRLENKSADLKVAMHLQEEPLIQPQQGFVSVDILRNQREILTLEQLLRDGEQNRPDNSDAVFPLGAEIDGTPYWIDLANSNTPSILIGGTSGSGKSELLKSIVVGLGMVAPPKSVFFTLIDPKRVTFTSFYDLPCLKYPVITDDERALQVLSELTDEMESRYIQFEKIRASDIVSYNNNIDNVSQRFCRHLIIIDEYADMLSDKAMTENLERCIRKLGSKGRAAGFHLILATQRPDAKVVTGLIRANLQLKIALKVTNYRNSQVILDESGAECLAGNGDMLIGGGVPLCRLQAALTRDEDVERLKRRWE